MSVLAAFLEDISKKAEPHFMRIGKELQSIYSDAMELTRQTLETVELFGGDLLEDMRKTAVQAFESTTSLSSHTENVRELSFETHLTAINAMIKAKQLGEQG